MALARPAWTDDPAVAFEYWDCADVALVQQPHDGGAKEVSSMSEVEDFKVGRESRAGVMHRVARSSGHSDVVQRMVEAAIYRDTHHAEPEVSTEDKAASDADG